MKIGDRVRIDCPASEWHGLEATIIEIVPNAKWHVQELADGVKQGEAAYLVDVDGAGTRNGIHKIGFPRRELKPIQPLGSWEELSRILGKDIRQPEVV